MYILQKISECQFLLKSNTWNWLRNYSNWAGQATFWRWTSLMCPAFQNRINRIKIILHWVNSLRLLLKEKEALKAWTLVEKLEASSTKIHLLSYYREDGVGNIIENTAHVSQSRSVKHQLAMFCVFHSSVVLSCIKQYLLGKSSMPVFRG